MRYKEINKRIDELMGVKKFASMTPQDIVEFLRNSFGTTGEFEPLGNGAHAVALAKGDDVYKFWLVDSAYETFVRYVQSSPNNKFLPVLRSGIKTLPAFFLRSANAPDTIKYVKMERLTPCRPELDFEFNVLTPRDGSTINMKMFLENVIESISSAYTADEVFDMVSSYYAQKGVNFGLNDDAETFIRTMFEISQLLGEDALDLHQHNFMMRGMTPVIIDPLYGPQDWEINQEFAEFYQTLNTNDIANNPNVKIGLPPRRKI